MDIVTRAKNILISPKTEWPVIEGEISDIPTVYTGYIMLLAAVPPLASLIGLSLLFPILGFGIGLVGAIVTYVLSLVGVYLVAWIAAKLAPNFGGIDDMGRAVKLVGYGWTAAWLGGIFHLVPALGILSFLASLYSLYLLYTGAPAMMRVPADRAIGYTAALIVAAIVVVLIIAVIAGSVVGAGMMGMGRY
jgi:hypothetical protein